MRQHPRAKPLKSSAASDVYKRQPTGGYYVGVDEAGVIRYICYESGDHRSGGPIYRNTPFGKFGDFNSSIERIKAKAPDLYAKIPL